VQEGIGVEFRVHGFDHAGDGARDVGAVLVD
jgi:hypothetical protein